jgi:hypothetical protein
MTAAGMAARRKRWESGTGWYHVAFAIAPRMLTTHKYTSGARATPASPALVARPPRESRLLMVKLLRRLSSWGAASKRWCGNCGAAPSAGTGQVVHFVCDCLDRWDQGSIVTGQCPNDLA